jgi:hypothetical protein
MLHSAAGSRIIGNLRLAARIAYESLGGVAECPLHLLGYGVAAHLNNEEHGCS